MSIRRLLEFSRWEQLRNHNYTNREFIKDKIIEILYNEIESHFCNSDNHYICTLCKANETTTNLAKELLK